MSKYAAVDTAIMAAIISGHRTFSDIFNSKELDVVSANSKFSVTERLVDRRLQALRKQKRILYQSKQWFLGT